MIRLNKNGKLGFQSPTYPNRKGFRSVGVDNYHYCTSHKFWYDPDEQDRFLYFAKPCIHTDYRYVSGGLNFYKEGMITMKGRKGALTLKACIHLINKTKNLPKGTLVLFSHKYYHRTKKGESLSMSYIFKVRKENKFDPKYEINGAEYTDNFTIDDKNKNLVDLLRKSGFIVRIGEELENDYVSSEDGMSGKRTNQRYYEYALAYGHGLKIGFSSGDECLFGYFNGKKEILFSWGEDFNKWSQCLGIDKLTDNKDIVSILLKRAKELKEEFEERSKENYEQYINK